MSAEGKHTATPWVHHGPGSVRVCDGRHDSPEGCQTILEAEIIGVSREVAEANARLIVSAVNQREELLEALRLCLPSRCQADAPQSPNKAPCGKCGYCRGSVALRKAEEEA